MSWDRGAEAFPLGQTLVLATAILPLLVGCAKRPAVDVGEITCDHPATIHVVATGLAHAEGEVRVALFTTGEGFPMDPTPALHTGSATVAGGTATFTFPGVPCGVYAVSVFHDENADGEMSTDFLGRPQEGWGVSNNARSVYRAPHFEEASFVADQLEVTVTLDMNY